MIYVMVFYTVCTRALHGPKKCNAAQSPSKLEPGQPIMVITSDLQCFSNHIQNVRNESLL